jgi:hypothetical protein
LAAKLSVATTGTRSDVFDRVVEYYERNGWPKQLDVELAPSEVGSLASDNEHILQAPILESQWTLMHGNANSDRNLRVLQGASVGTESSVMHTAQIMQSLQDYVESRAGINALSAGIRRETTRGIE